MRAHLFIFVALSAPTLHAGESQADARARLELFQSTQMIFVESYAGQAQDFVPDDNPKSIQIVPLALASQGKSHVSQDGQVIFLRPNDERKMEKLIEEAFTKLLAARNAGT